MADDEPTSMLSELEPIGSAPLAPAHGLAAVALTMAMKYADIATVQDGALYQQYKLEGRNFTNLDLADIFENAMRIEAHLLAAPNRISAMIFEAVIDGALDDEDQSDDEPRS